MSENLLYLPSGKTRTVPDVCRDCATGDFPGEVIMVFDAAAPEVYVICRRCYRRRKHAAHRRACAALVRCGLGTNGANGTASA